MSKPIVLVTGGTGFLGSHVISQLLANDQYIVRGVARSAQKLRAIFPEAGSSLQVVEIPSLTSDFSAALKDVEAVVHMASPVYMRGESGEEILQGAYEGTVHIVEQAIELGIKKIVMTGTYASLFDTSFTNAFGTKSVSEKDFGPITLKDIDTKDPNTMMIYQAAKTVADKKIWEIAHQHPDVDVTVLLPPMILGPVVPNYPVTSRLSLSTNDYIYELLFGKYPAFPVGDMVDVRDIARAHIVALSKPPVPGKDKRFIVAYGKYYWKKVAELVRRERPELAHRLPKEDEEAGPQMDAPLDLTFTKDVLGFNDYYGWEETVLAALDSALALEKKD